MGATNVIREIRRATRRKFSAEEKIRIVVEGLRGEISVSALCRREGIAPTMYYRWSKAFLEAGKNGLTRDTRRDATAQEVRQRKEENEVLKKALAEAILDVQNLGMTAANLATYMNLLQHTHGLILVTGPTGSGKTTFSPYSPGSELKRRSMQRCRVNTCMRPSCGSRLSAMSRFAITFRRDTMAGCSSMRGVMTSYSTPSTRKRTREVLRLGSIWISLAPS